MQFYQEFFFYLFKRDFFKKRYNEFGSNNFTIFYSVRKTKINLVF